MVFAISNTMITLDKIEQNKTYQIKAFNPDLVTQDSVARMMQLGLNPGTEVTLERRAPLFKDPLLIKIDGLQLVISVEQASGVLIEESVCE
jgi:Fe2+ transport system protein FeoA